MSELITPPGAPVAAGPYSPGLLTGDWIFLSGQGGFDPETGELVSDNIADQTAQVFRNIEVLLRAAGASLDDVVRTRIYVVNIAADWENVGRAHGEVFGAIRPATSMVEVRALIDPAMLVEIEADAIVTE